MKEIRLTYDQRLGTWPGTTLHTGEEYKIVLVGNPRKRVVLEFHEDLFRLESAVVLPEREIPSSGAGGNRTVSPVGMIAAVLKHLRGHNENVADPSMYHRVLVAGHTDTAGNLDYNRELSQNRAKAVLSLITGDAATFGKICHQLNRWMKVSDYKQILTWLSQNNGWDCNPGAINDNHDNRTQTAVNNFKAAYNQNGPGASWAPKIKPEWGDPNTQETWQGYFHCYEEYIAKELGTDIDGLGKYRSFVQYASPNQWVGCNEYHPRIAPGVDGLREQANRRGEVMTFAPGDAPDSLDCCPNRAACSKAACKLFDPKEYIPVPWIIFPLSAVGTATIRVEMSDTNGTCTPDSCGHVFRLFSTDPALTYDHSATIANGQWVGTYVVITYQDVITSLSYSLEVIPPAGQSYRPFENVLFSDI